MAAAAPSGGVAGGDTLGPLVSAEWLKRHLGEVKVLAAPWYLPTQNRDPLAEFAAERIPGARFFDVDRISDPGSPLPHMLPSAAAFAAAADALGISDGDAVVVYDHLGAFSAPRVWWTWHVFGHRRVAVLDGGLPAWKAAGGEVETAPVSAEAVGAPAAAARASPPPPAGYRARLAAAEVRDWRAILANVESRAEQVVDARPAGRWKGEAPEPRPGLKQGRIPGSANVPWDSVLREGKFKSPEELRATFEAAGVDLSKPVVASCGTGTTACLLVLAAQLVAPGTVVPVYDGSWSEWGALPDVPVLLPCSARCLSARRATAPRFQPARAMSDETKEDGHQVPSSSVVAEESQDPEILAYQRHQATAARLSLAEEARTLVEGAKFGVLSTLASTGELAGFPSGSAVEFAADASGRFTVLAEGFRGISDARVNLIGRAAPVGEAEQAAVREAYLAKHPNSFWVDFGDFRRGLGAGEGRRGWRGQASHSGGGRGAGVRGQGAADPSETGGQRRVAGSRGGRGRKGGWWRLDEVLQARVVGGFARAGKVAGDEYAAAQPDPIAPFSAPVAGHMNAVDSATILSIDRLGMNVSCTRQGQDFKARLPFPRPATDRKSVKDLIVEMTQAAAAAGTGAPA
eukprot:scaffold13.g171.t1